MTKITELIAVLNQWAPRAYQESYDNSQLIVGDSDWEINGTLLTLDATEAVIDEAISKNCNLVVAHHPIIFSGLKSITGKTYIERTIIKAIKNDVAILACHTNLDNVISGVNSKIAHLIGLENCQILRPKSGTVGKIVSFVPASHLSSVLQALHQAGAGMIGDYQNCSFVSDGEGRFKPGKSSKPYIGNTGEAEIVKEKRIELTFPLHLEREIKFALKKAHPYEEVTYYMSHVINTDSNIGSGLVGSLPSDKKVFEFMDHLKSSMNLEVVRMTVPCKKTIKKVALCGGSGSFLLADAKAAKADIFITADYKYHQFFDAENDIIIADIGHYESEVYTKELMAEYLTKKFITFAIHLSQVNTNPVQYY